MTHTEMPCQWCGETTGGNLALHKGGCPYVVGLATKYPAVAALVRGKSR